MQAQITRCVRSAGSRLPHTLAGVRSGASRLRYSSTLRPSPRPDSSSGTNVAEARRLASTAAIDARDAPDTTTDLDLMVADLPGRWKDMSAETKNRLTQSLFLLQTRDWKTLSLDEKRALYWIAFGPHGYREPFHPPGFGLKVFSGTMAATFLGFVLWWAFDRTYVKPNEPETLSREWQEKTNKWAKEHNINPIHGISSKDNKGSGFVDKFRREKN